MSCFAHPLYSLEFVNFLNISLFVVQQKWTFLNLVLNVEFVISRPNFQPHSNMLQHSLRTDSHMAGCLTSPTAAAKSIDKRGVMLFLFCLTCYVVGISMVCRMDAKL